MEDSPAVIETPEPIKARRDWFGMIVGLAALATSVVSIIIGVQNSNSMDRLVQANSWPYLQLESSNADESRSRIISIKLRNAGIGPLKIRSFVVSSDGKVHDDFIELLISCCAKIEKKPSNRAETLEQFGYTITATPSGAVLAPGDSVLVYELPLSGAREEVWNALDRSRRSNQSFRACYCSVFDECWTTDFKSPNHHKVDFCPAESSDWKG